MKIAILTPEYISESNNWHGGLSNYLNRIAKGLKDRGHNVHVFTYSFKKEVITLDGVTIHRITANNFLLRIVNKLTFRLFRDVLQILFISRAFKKYFLPVNKVEKFNIIHSSSCQAPALLLDSRKIGAPIVTRLSSITRLCHVVSCRKNKLDMYLLNWAEKHLALKSDKVFAPSILAKKNALKEFGIQIDLIESPEYFVDIDDSDLDFSVYNRYFKEKKYILFYGTLSRLKGSEFIADTIYDFLNKYRDYYFVMVGKMVQHRKNSMPIELILEKAKSHKQRIIYTNSLRHKQLFPIIKNARAVFLPSIIDNFPNTFIESMSMGKVVIGTYGGGFDQLIVDGKNGFLLNYGDSEKLKKIYDLICKEGGQQMEKIGKEAKKTVNERLNFDKKITELEKYYEHAIKDFNK